MTWGKGIKSLQQGDDKRKRKKKDDARALLWWFKLFPAKFLSSSKHLTDHLQNWYAIYRSI